MNSEFTERCVALAMDIYMSNGAISDSAIFFADTGNPDTNATWVLPYFSESDEDTREAMLMMVSAAMSGRSAQRYGAMVIVRQGVIDNKPAENGILFVVSSDGEKPTETAAFEVIRDGGEVSGFRQLSKNSMFDVDSRLTSMMSGKEVSKDAFMSAEYGLAPLMVSGVPAFMIEGEGGSSRRKTHRLN